MSSLLVKACVLFLITEKKSLLIKFHVSGHLESRPTFIRKSADGCTYEFEWHTSAACPLGDYTGQNCKVTDPTEGKTIYSFH